MQEGNSEFSQFETHVTEKAKKKLDAQVKIPSDLKRKLAAEGVRLDIFDYELVERMWEVYENAMASSPHLAPEIPASVVETPAGTRVTIGESGEEVQRLYRILASGHHSAVPAIKQNLIAFEELACGGSHPQKPAGPAPAPNKPGGMGRLREIRPGARRGRKHTG